MSLRYEECGHLQRGLKGGVSAIAFSPDGTYIATAGQKDVKVYIWRVADNKLLHTYSGSEHPVLSLEWLPGCTDTVLCGSKGGYILVLRFTSTIAQVTGFWAHSRPIERLAAKGAQLVSGAFSEVFIWRQDRTDDWVRVGDLPCPYTDTKNIKEDVVVMGIHWTKTRAYPSVVIVTYMFHGIVMYDAADWTRLQSIPLSEIGGSCVSPAGSRIALSVMGFGFDLYDLDTGDCIASFPDQHSAARTLPVLIVHGGLALLGGSTAGKAVLWNIDNQLVHQTFPASQHPEILAIAANYNPDLDQFLIATGASEPTSKPDGESIVTLYVARDVTMKAKSTRMSWFAMVSYVLAATAVGLALLAWELHATR